jgi:hypothetical protein
MAALSFKERFVDPVLDGSKKQTIRNFRKYPIKPGETLYLYYAMRTKHCKKLKDVPCKSVSQVILTKKGILVTDLSTLKPVSITELHALNDFAIADGFVSWEEMKLWWTMTHKLPFTGQLIQW